MKLYGGIIKNVTERGGVKRVEERAKDRFLGYNTKEWQF
jgi:hypothetical protein